MKKVLLTAAAALTIFAMVACNSKTAEESATEETATTEQCEHKCMHEGDSAMCCKAMADDSTKTCCKKAEGQECQKQCEKKCEKAQ